jgi:hypothetical protein
MIVINFLNLHSVELKFKFKDLKTLFYLTVIIVVNYCLHIKLDIHLKIVHN